MFPLSLLAATLLPTDALFEKDVAPVLVRRCLECHAGKDASGGLDLSTRAGLRAGGDKGVVVVPGKSADSPLLSRVVAHEMPPPKKGVKQPLPREEVAALKVWIDKGAAWPDGRTLDVFERSTPTRGGRDLWSLQPIADPPIPNIANAGNNPIDAFVRAGLAKRGWVPAPPAPRRQLIRRVMADIVGLPPTAAQVRAFEADTRPDAYERLVDRLLASPHFGERWGRYWLDVARYAETAGYERDQVFPGVWKYRDWVVRAFNDDMPYDRFLTDQLAGDEIASPTESSRIATGFLRLGTWNDEPNDPKEYVYDRLEDMVHATSTAFLGLTVKCARCHDHKFDPIRQTDYYRMGAAFWPGPMQAGPRELLGGPDKKLMPGEVTGWTDLAASAADLRLLRKGDPNRPGPVVAVGHSSFVPALDKPFDPPPAGSKTTTRRLQLSKWFVDPRHPLTARVWANRLWQFHFGTALVRTPDNFGFNGEKPTHPELLDWLASRLKDGWDAKRLHRMMLLSETYRQSSIHPRQEEYASVDAGNRLWWRAERRRLDAESLRDALLHASGELRSETMGGPSFSPEIAPEALEGLSTKSAAWRASPEAEQARRAVYIFSKRGLLVPLLTTFDFGDTTAPVCRRETTTVAPQALALLNNPFVHRRSATLAERIKATAKDDESRIVAAWEAVLARPPSATETVAAREHVTRRGLASLCHVLMNTNEFATVD